ncbi:MAG: PQQ-binding-like beta-propeller repeat protein, partial [Pirellulales bacterium]|nr:PQQ-binding-like beta-propeller repeat protein [Pirellulales bacterium]
LFRAILVFSLATCEAPGQEWPRFRGPNGTGVSDARTIPASWTDGDYRWRVELPGIGYSSPVVAGSRLFITSGLEDDATQVVTCLSIADGAVLWQRKLSSAPHPRHPFNCYAASTPALDDDSVYFLWAEPGRLSLVKLDQPTGQERWRRDLGPFLAEHAIGASPIVFEESVIVPNEQDGASSIVALDRATGETRWLAERRTEKTAYATPCLFQLADGQLQLLVNSWAHGFSALDPRTGETLWELPILNYRVVNSPAVAGGLVFGSCGTGGIGRQMFAVRPGNPRTGTPPEVAYELTGSLPYVVTPIGVGDLLFSWYDKGIVTCLEASTGKIVWKERIGGEYFASPVCVGDRLYGISRDGRVVVLAASRRFEELARIDLGERTNATPAIAGGAMYLRTASHVIAIGPVE